MVEESSMPDLLVTRFREIKYGSVLCPLEYVENEEHGSVPLDRCVYCRNFIKIEDNKVMCSITWL